MTQIERDYVGFSELPNRTPDDVPPGAQKVGAEKSKDPADQKIRLSFDAV